MPITPAPLDYHGSSDHSTEKRQTLVYFGGLTLWVYLATPVGPLIDIQTAFLLKNQLHATPGQVSTFRLLTGVPIYFAFVFGLVRDSWSPLGLRDRGYFLIFAPVTAAVCLWTATTDLTYQKLVVAMLEAMVTSRLVIAAYQGLMALIAQEKLMSGRLSALWNIISTLLGVAAAFGSGFISSHLRPAHAFLLAGCFWLMIACQGLWKPRGVFARAYEAPQAGAGKASKASKFSTFFADVRRLLRHRAVYPAVLIQFLWSFAPGANTPLQYYLTDRLGAPDAYYSYYTGIFGASFVPMYFLYGFLCRRVSLNKLLWWGTIIAVPQMVPLAFIRSPGGALLLAVPIGLMGGIATAAYYDLAMRSCPPGLQGTLMMLVDGVLVLAGRGGDVLGTAIYDRSPTHGFVYCVIAITIVYALILPLIALVPRRLISTADGEAGPETQG
jgi:hypothetical protein